MALLKPVIVVALTPEFALPPGRCGLADSPFATFVDPAALAVLACTRAAGSGLRSLIQ